MGVSFCIYGFYHLYYSMNRPPMQEFFWWRGVIFTICTKNRPSFFWKLSFVCVFYTHRASFAACADVPSGVNGLPNAKTNAIPERMAFFLVLYGVSVSWISIHRLLGVREHTRCSCLLLPCQLSVKIFPCAFAATHDKARKYRYDIIFPFFTTCRFTNPHQYHGVPCIGQPKNSHSGAYGWG